MGAGRGAQGNAPGSLEQAQQKFAAAGIPYPGSGGPSGNPPMGAGGGKGNAIANLPQGGMNSGRLTQAGANAGLSDTGSMQGQVWRGPVAGDPNRGSGPTNYQSAMQTGMGNQPPPNWGANLGSPQNQNMMTTLLQNMSAQKPPPQAPPPQAPPPVTPPPPGAGATPNTAPVAQSGNQRANAQQLGQGQVRGLNRATAAGNQGNYLAQHQGVQQHLNKLQGGSAAQQQRAGKLLGAPPTGASGGKTR